jgi:hypothetical protein
MATVSILCLAFGLMTIANGHVEFCMEAGHKCRVYGMILRAHSKHGGCETFKSYRVIQTTVGICER